MCPLRFWNYAFRLPYFCSKACLLITCMHTSGVRGRDRREMIRRAGFRIIKKKNPPPHCKQKEQNRTAHALPPRKSPHLDLYARVNPISNELVASRIRGHRTQLPSPLLQLPHDGLQVADALVEDVDLVLVLVDVGVLHHQSAPHTGEGQDRTEGCTFLAEILAVGA